MKYRIIPNQSKRIRVNDFTPALHPRDPDTGKFVERPYDVPDNIADMPTQQIIADAWADDPNFAENLESVAVDMGDIGPQTVDTIIERAREQGGIISGPRAQRRDIFESVDLDMSFDEFEERVNELTDTLPLDNEGAALAVANQQLTEV